MHVVLVVQDGPSAGRKTWVGPGQSVQVGRTDRADFVVPRDGMISGVHFTLECRDDKSCHVRDLNSSNGLFLNGEKVTEAIVRDGDRIVAGQTTFAVRVEVGARAAAPDARPGPSESRTPATSAEPEPQPPLAPGHRVSLPASGPVAFSTLAGEHPAIEPTPPRDRGAVPPHRGPRLESAVLEVRSGPGRGKVWVRPGQRIAVGRTEEADFAVPGDAQMSGVHFVLECDASECRLLDQQSASGTLVNGEPVSEAVLNDGDRVTAGQTTFVMTIKGGAIRAAAAGSPDAPPRRQPSHGAPAAPRPAGRPRYTVAKCSSGLAVFRGAPGEPKPAGVARLLAKWCPVHLIVDLNRLKLPAPDDMAEAEYLFDMLPRQVVAANSPLVVCSNDTRELYSLVERAWGNDALVCLYSRREKPSLLDHLRAVARCAFPAFGESKSERVLGFCWPGILELMLAHGDPDFVRYLLSGIEAFLLEFGAPDAWQLFARGELAQTLDKLGFVETPIEKAKEV